MQVELVGGIVDGLIVEVDSLVLAIFIPQLTGSGLVKYRYVLTNRTSANSFPIYEYSDATSTGPQQFDRQELP